MKPPVTTKKGKEKRSPKRSGRIESEQESKKPLFELLRKIRKEIAQKKNVPPYVIFHDKTLLEMCEVKPKTELEMLQINGVGAHKFKLYGDAFLNAFS